MSEIEKDVLDPVEQEETDVVETTDTDTEVREPEAGGKAEKETATPKDDPDRERKGLLADIKGERRKRQQAEELNRQLQDRLDAIERRLTGGKPADAPEGEAADEDDIMTVAQFKKYQKEVREEARREREEAERNSQLKALAKSEKVAKRRHNLESEGEGLDYDSVVEIGREHLTEADIDEIRDADNPAEELYVRCVKASPHLRRLRDLVKKDKGGGTPPPKKPVSMRREPGSRVGEVLDPEMQTYLDMPESELERVLREGE